jgi:HK97 family phage prohead protease
MADEMDVAVATEIERRDWEFADDGGVAVETRADGRTVLSGYAVRYNTTSVDLGGFRETILPGAFDKVLNRQRGKRDVVALFNHDANQLLGRTSSGTLELSSDDKGLRYSVVLPNTELGRTISELTARGDLRGSSFAFTVEQKGHSWAPGEDGVPRRSIREVSGLFDVSVVTHPAYSSSSAAVARRSMEAWMAEQEEVRCSCQHQAKDADESFAADSARAKSMAVRLKAAVLRTMIRGRAGHVRGFCATGQGGGIDPTCGNEGGGGGGGGGGDKAAGAGSSSGGRKERYRDRIEGTQKEADREVKKANDKVAKIQKKLDEVKSQMGTGRVEAAKEKVAAAQSKLKEATARKESLTQKVEASKARIAELKAKLDAMKKRSDDKDPEAALLAAIEEMDGLRKQLAAVNDDLDSIASDLG